MESRVFRFTYDASGRPLSLIFDGTAYWYDLNLQGDVVGILDSYGNTVMSYTYNAWGCILSITGSEKDTIGFYNPLRYRGYVWDPETGLYYLQSRYYSPGLGRFINADAFTSTGQGLLGNNMFAYCRNNPVNRKDHSGMSDEDATDDENEDKKEPFLIQFLRHMARQRENGLTFSVGYTVGALWGDSGGSTAQCISVDSSYNYAIQQSDSVCAGMGTGASGGLVFSCTSADNVRDLEGASSSYGVTICEGFGMSIDYVTFNAATKPNEKCWGITVSLLCGAEADVHRSESFTTTKSKKIWNPFEALLDAFSKN